MRALRTIPVMLDFAQTMEEVCPDVLFLNYTNPMAMLCMEMNRATAIKTVGLCHSVHNTAADIAHWLDIPFEEVNFLCGGINHVAFMLRYERDGEDLYPALRQFAAEHREPAWERVRFELLRRFGYFVTESSEHFSEYVPWFIKPGRDDLIQKFNIPLDEYPARCEDQISDWSDFRDALTASDPEALPRYQEARRGRLHGMDARRIAVVEKEDPALAASMREVALAERQEEQSSDHSGEYGTLIIHSIETGQPRLVYGNVTNRSSIANLLQPCCVEIPCLVDRNGVQPTVVGTLPPQLTALMQTNINVQELTVEASLTGNREHVYQAAMLDPHTAAELDPEQICSLVDELLEAHGSMIAKMA